MRQSLRIVMIASLTLNLVVAGVIGGALLSGRDRPVRFGGYDFTLGPFTRALSREDRRTIGEELRNRPELGPQERGSRKAALDTFLAAVAADPFDAAAVSLIFAAQRDRALRGMSAGQEVLLARIVQMTSAERGDFAARLRTELESGRRR
jgi:uncharacterized membrane protein